MKRRSTLWVMGWLYAFTIAPLLLLAALGLQEALQLVRDPETGPAVQHLLLYFGVGVVVVSVCAYALLFVAGRTLAKPIARLARTARGMQPGEQIVLPEGALAEAEELAAAVNEMSRLCAEHLTHGERTSAQFAALFEQAPAALISTDRNGKILGMNPAAEKLFGVTSLDAVRRMALTDLFYPSDFTSLRVAMQYVGEDFPTLVEHAKRNPSGATLRFSRSDGAQGYAVVVLGCLSKGGNSDDGYMVVVTDDTFRRQAEDERITMQRRALDASRLESLGLLAGGVAHDFNNLLTGIFGYLELVEAEVEGNERAKEYLRATVGATGRARELCRHMLDYAGRNTQEGSIVDINALARDCGTLVGASSKEVRVVYELADESAMVKGVGARLHQVVMNLVVNAADAMKGRLGAITIASQCVDIEGDPEVRDGEYVQLTVRDDGCGMSTETLERVFEPFFTTKPTGTGIGLAAAVNIVREHGGRISVSSTLNVGTTFTLLFPRHVEPAASSEAARPVVRGHALVIDDDSGMRDLFEAALEHLGLKVILASGGYEGIAAWRAARTAVDLVFIDLTMPDMDGEEVLRVLRHEGCEARAFFVSGLEMNIVQRRLKGLDYADFIPKPCAVQDIANAVNLGLGGTDDDEQASA